MSLVPDNRLCTVYVEFRSLIESVVCAELTFPEVELRCVITVLSTTLILLKELNPKSQLHIANNAIGIS